MLKKSRHFYFGGFQFVFSNVGEQHRDLIVIPLIKHLDMSQKLKLVHVLNTKFDKHLIN